MMFLHFLQSYIILMGCKFFFTFKTLFNMFYNFFLLLPGLLKRPEAFGTRYFLPFVRTAEKQGTTDLKKVA